MRSNDDIIGGQSFNLKVLFSRSQSFYNCSQNHKHFAIWSSLNWLSYRCCREIQLGLLFFSSKDKTWVLVANLQSQNNLTQSFIFCVYKKNSPFFLIIILCLLEFITSCSMFNMGLQISTMSPDIPELGENWIVCLRCRGRQNSRETWQKYWQLAAL
jgi:hypothetical protein